MILDAPGLRAAPPLAPVSRPTTGAPIPRALPTPEKSPGHVQESPEGRKSLASAGSRLPRPLRSRTSTAEAAPLRGGPLQGTYNVGTESVFSMSNGVTSPPDLPKHPRLPSIPTQPAGLQVPLPDLVPGASPHRERRTTYTLPPTTPSGKTVSARTPKRPAAEGTPSLQECLAALGDADQLLRDGCEAELAPIAHNPRVGVPLNFISDDLRGEYYILRSINCGHTM